MTEEAGICVQPPIPKRSRVLRRVWAWCRSHKLILSLLAIIAFQQFLLARASSRMHAAQERDVQAVFDLLQKTGDLTLENLELKDRIKEKDPKAPR